MNCSDAINVVIGSYLNWRYFLVFSFLVFHHSLGSGVFKKLNKETRQYCHITIKNK